MNVTTNRNAAFDKLITKQRTPSLAVNTRNFNTASLHTAQLKLSRLWSSVIHTT